MSSVSSQQAPGVCLMTRTPTGFIVLAGPPYVPTPTWGVSQLAAVFQGQAGLACHPGNQGLPAHRSADGWGARAIRSFKSAV